MAININVINIFSFFFCFSLKHNLTLGADTIFANQSLSGAQTIVSPNGNFKLGFFHPGNSVPKNGSYYLGIWYNKKTEGEPEVSVWIANREKPIFDIESAVLTILDENLVLLNEFKQPIWSTNNAINSSSGSNDLVAVLRNDGNLVLTGASNLDTKSPFWQSFDNPGNTWLPGAKISFNKRTRTRQILTSWKSDTDPAPGLYSLELLDLNGSQIILKWNGSQQYFTTGTWNGLTFSLPSLNNYLYNFSNVDNENEAYFTYYMYDHSSMARMKMDPNGQMKQLILDGRDGSQSLMASDPSQLCHIYAYCGAFGICDNTSLPNCYCPDGFDSLTTNDVEAPSGGCLRNKPLKCGNSTSSNDRFQEISNIFLTEQTKNSTVGSIVECESTCLRSCFYNAYAYDNGLCSIWNGDIFNMQRVGTGRTIYIRLGAVGAVLNHRSRDNHSKGLAIFGAVLGASVIFLGILLVVFCRRREKMIKRNKANQDSILASSYGEVHITLEKEIYKLICGFFGVVFKGKLPPVKEELSHIKTFSIGMIQVATDKFSAPNKLGEGGFGPVFKGVLPSGQQIAVKRLSKSSGQGFEEFKNEVTLISKVQHRNLVKLLGFCTHGEERMLVYEYMPNKSLDTFIFGSATNRTTVLDWGLRMNIIEGIARGLLYLHRDSRLKIIHRDLKASNILPDEHMIPRISDFGLARIVMIDQSVANTNRVVGTYGYMAPEYALQGIVSVKLDVFSFGVLLLEIVSGKRTSSFSDHENALNLLGYVWKLWNQDTTLEDKAFELLDSNLYNLCNTEEVYRCIHVALLCVQENLNDRPTMSEVVFMLCNDTNLPTPNQPAFCWTRSVDDPSSRLPQEIFVNSKNEMSTSFVYGR